MPDRVLRAGLLTSEPWLGLKNNDDRVCWLALFLNADVFGNQPAGPHRLVHLFRHAGIDTPEKAAKVLDALHDVDLARPYVADGKPYVHLPRYRQRLRYLGHVNPLSPWNTEEEKQRLARKSPATASEPPVTAGESPTDVDVDVDVEVKQVQERMAVVDTPALPRAPSKSNKSPNPNRGSRLPKDWTLPAEWQRWAVDAYNVDAQRVFRESLKFRDHFWSVPGVHGVKVDWLATWRKWCRREYEHA